MRVFEILILIIGFSTVSVSKEEVDHNRYLLYDVNPPEGFNLRRDVYMRMANMVKLLRKRGEPWTLVLPPFSNLYHWKSVLDQEKMPWSMFFDVESLSHLVPVMEFSKFLSKMQENMDQTDASSVLPVIDDYYQLQQDNTFFETGIWKDGVEVAECDEMPEIRLIKGVYRGRFFGYTDVAARRFGCVTASADIEIFADWLHANSQAKVVMLSHAEVIIHGQYSEWSAEWWTARRSMRYAKHLVAIADKFRAENLQSTDEQDQTVLPADWRKTLIQPGAAKGGPYVCVHWRRGDYVAAYPVKSPSARAAAKQVINWLKKVGLTDVFLSTDTYENEVYRLTYLLKEENFRLVKYIPDRATLTKILDGGVAIVDQNICSHARLFVGSYSSTFSFRIQEDRSILGFSPESTFNRLCGDNETETECDQPTQWKVVYPIKQNDDSTGKDSNVTHEEL